MKTTELQQLMSKHSWSSKLKGVNPQPIRASLDGLVETSYLEPESCLPLVVKPHLVDLDLPGWAGDNAEFIETNLSKHGGLLFRGFAVKTQADFERFLEAICPRLMSYMEGATPRTRLSEKVYTSTEFPPDHSIALHNELTYVTTFPMKIWFFCVSPAAQGGATPIGDVRRVFQRIPQEIKDLFLKKGGWMLVRNYGKGFGPSWKNAYHTTDRDGAEAYFRAAGIEFEWGDGERLRTRQVRPAVATHPKTGDQVWFNHVAFWHVSSLEPKLREMFLAEFKEEDLPYNTYYGDGSLIEDSVVEVLREAYRQETVIFDWQEGDILMLDNMLVAHGRTPFAGPRRVLVAMGEPWSRIDCAPLGDGRQ